MRVFVAGATGVIGIRLVPLLVSAGHLVTGMTRTPGKVALLHNLGAEAVVCDVFDDEALLDAVAASSPDVVVHQLTDLPDEAARIPEHHERNNRIRTEGTANLVGAAKAAGASRIVAQSIAWRAGEALDRHEQAVLSAGGTVLRYGQFYGPGTYFEREPPPTPRIHVDEAARRTVAFLDGPAGVVVLTDEA